MDSITVLVDENIDLVHSISVALASRNGALSLLDELKGAAGEALFEGATKWNGNGEFRAYARKMIRYRIYDEMRFWWHRNRYGRNPLIHDQWLPDEYFSRISNTDESMNPETTVVRQEAVNDILRVLDSHFTKIQVDSLLHRFRSETLTQVGERYGVSESRICQIRTVAVERLRRTGMLDSLIAD